MEPITGVVFIGAIIAGVTEALRNAFTTVNGAVTVAVAAIVGLLVALIDVQIGVQNITVAQGILIGLGAAGVTGALKKIG